MCTRCTRAWAYVQMLGTCIECHGSISYAFRVAFNCHRISFECHWLASHVIRDIRWHWMPCDVWGHSDTIQWHVKDVRRHWMAGLAMVVNDTQRTFDDVRAWFDSIWKTFLDMRCYSATFEWSPMTVECHSMKFKKRSKKPWHSMQVA